MYIYMLLYFFKIFFIYSFSFDEFIFNLLVLILFLRSVSKYQHIKANRYHLVH